MSPLGATQPVVSPLAKVCYLGGRKRCRCSKRAVCLSARWKITMIRGGFGPRDGPQVDTAGGDRSHMKCSKERILTTHTGSLPRTAKVVELLLAEQKNPGARKAELDAAVREVIARVVQKQIECGIDIVNDGEQGRTDYTVHVLDRLAGFAGESTPPLGTGDAEFPELAQLLHSFRLPVPVPTGLYRRGELEELGRCASRHRLVQGRVLRGCDAAELFMTVAVTRPDRALSQEQALQNRRGLRVCACGYDEVRIQGDRQRKHSILQLDCPDLAMLRHTVYLDRMLFPISATSLR